MSHQAGLQVCSSGLGTLLYAPEEVVPSPLKDWLLSCAGSLEAEHQDLKMETQEGSEYE